MPDAIEKDPLFLLYDVARMMRVHADKRARTRGMTRAQWVILVHLERSPGLSQSELAGLVEVEPITVARLIDRLEARGMVERRHDPRDRRIWRLHLTDAADAELAEIHAYRAELRRVMSDGVDTPAQQVMTNALLRMKENLIADGQPDHEPAMTGALKAKHHA